MWAEDTSYKPVCFDYNNINYIIKYYTFELQISVEKIDKKKLSKVVRDDHEQYIKDKLPSHL